MRHWTSSVSRDGVRQAITDEVARCRASTGLPIVIAAPWRHDPHPDHRAVGEAAAPIAPGWGAVVPPAMLAHHDQQLLLTDGPRPAPEEPNFAENAAGARPVGEMST